MAAASAPPGVTAQQLADTFALVRQMGLLMRDMQAENQRLRSQVAGLTDALQAKATDFEQRLAAAAAAMHDARDEDARLRAQVATLGRNPERQQQAIEQRLNLALARTPAGVASEPDKRQAEALAPSASTSASDNGVVAPDAAATGFARTVGDYRVQAASLGLAVLGDANAAPRQAGGRWSQSVTRCPASAGSPASPRRDIMGCADRSWRNPIRPKRTAGPKPCSTPLRPASHNGGNVRGRPTHARRKARRCSTRVRRARRGCAIGRAAAPCAMTRGCPAPSGAHGRGRPRWRGSARPPTRSALSRGMPASA